MSELVADTSVLIDLKRANLCKEALALPYHFFVPDYLYQKELADDFGPELVGYGLVSTPLEPNQVQAAVALQQANFGLSLSDTFVLILAKGRKAEILTGDGVMRDIASAQGVPCRGVLWVFDELFKADPTSAKILHAALTRLSSHPRCRLPRKEIQARLALYANAAP